MTHLLDTSEINVPKEQQADVFQKLYPTWHSETYDPNAKEFILRSKHHRMYTLISQQEFRIAIVKETID